jgi:putative membrane protein
MNGLKTFLCGVIIGIANIIPGVSGGTMAVILNVYDKMLFACSLKHIKNNSTFLGFLGAGTLFGIFCFSSGITYLYEHFYMIVNYCFIGLVLGSVPMIYEKAKYTGVQPKNWIPFILALFFMIGIAIIKMMNASLGANGSAASGVEALPFHILLVWLFISAFISTIAMLLPGISGSFMMLLFGCYTLVMKAIAEMDFIILFCAGLGVAAGGLVGIKLIKIMLRKHPQALYFAILGLVVGSIFSIFPGFTFDIQGLLAGCGLLVCAGVSYGFGRLG